MLSQLKSTPMFKQKLSSELEQIISTSNLPISPLIMELITFTWVLGSSKVEWLSQALSL
jgi:hypothetical protein